MTAKVADKLAIVRSVSDYGRATGDHHAGYYYNLTGHAPDQTFRTQGNNRRPYPDDWPFMGSVIGSRRPQHSDLPAVDYASAQAEPGSIYPAGAVCRETRATS